MTLRDLAMIVERARREPRARRRLHAASWLCWSLCGAACSVDAVVFHALAPGAPADAGQPPRDAGLAPPMDTGPEPPRDAGPVPPPDAGGAAGGGGMGGGESRSACKGAGGAIAIVSQILGLPTDPEDANSFPCTSDRDCMRTLFTPVCEENSMLCIGCADPFVNVQLGLCLPGAIESCCADENSAANCIIQACSMSCGAR
jgi:hypothetical protein